MSIRRILLGVAFVAFVTEAVAVTWMVGIGGTVEAMLANPVTRLLTAEVTLCLVMLGVWMARDAKERGINAWPYLGSMLVLGGGAPLLYFVMHPERAGEASEGAEVPAAHPAQVRA